VGEHQVLTDEFACSQSSLHETETGLISLLKIVRPRIVDVRKTRAVGLIKSRKRFLFETFFVVVYISRKS